MSGGREWLLALGLLAGYGLLMGTTSVRHPLLDGARALRRYPRLWIIPAGFGLFYALFHAALSLFFFVVLPMEQRPAFGWRLNWELPAWSPQLQNAHTFGAWLGALFADPLWVVVRDAGLEGLESVAGLFNNVVTTFPLSAAGAVMLLMNWDNHHATLAKALKKRFGRWGWVLHAGILACAVSAILEPALFSLLYLHRGTPGFWLRCGTVVDWLSSIFAYLFGAGVQVYLILVVYTWLRGLNWTPVHLMDLAIRRFSFVVKWGAVVMAVSSVMIDLPRVIVLLFRFDDPVFMDHTLIYTDRIARPLLALFLICFSTMQITLTFHSETLGKALLQHSQFVARHWGEMFWFAVIAVVHLFGFALLDRTLRLGFGFDSTLPSLIWSLVRPVLGALLAAWLLSAWVSLYKRCESGRVKNPDWIPF